MRIAISFVLAASYAAAQQTLPLPPRQLFPSPFQPQTEVKAAPALPPTVWLAPKPAATTPKQVHALRAKPCTPPIPGMNIKPENYAKDMPRVKARTEIDPEIVSPVTVCPKD